MRRCLFAVMAVSLCLLLSACGPAMAAPATGWQEFSSPEGNFTVSMPGTPTKSTQTAYGVVGNIYQLQHGDEVFMVSYADLPAQFAQADPDPGLEGAVSGSLATVNGTLVSKRTIYLSGYEGKDISAGLPMGHIWARYYLVGPRLYEVAVVSPLNDGKDVARFLDSFQLGTHESTTSVQGTTSGPSVVTPLPGFRATTVAVATANAPKPTATAGPPPPTLTPLPTFTPWPTATPRATDTPYHSPTQVHPTPLPAGATAMLDDLTFTVNRVRIDAVGSGPLTPGQGNVFVIVDLTVQNVDSRTAAFNSLLTQVRDAKGNEYRTALDPNAGKAPDVFVQPGSSSRGEISYAVPAGARGLAFVYRSIAEGTEVSLSLGR